jgi:hypothetical protein
MRVQATRMGAVASPHWARPKPETNVQVLQQIPGGADPTGRSARAAIHGAMEQPLSFTSVC